MLQSGYQIAKTHKLDSLIDVNLKKYNVSRDEVISMFSEVKSKMDSLVNSQLKTMLEMKKAQLLENPKVYAIKETSADTTGNEGSENEIDKLTVADLLYYSRKFYESARKYNPNEVQKFFPISKCVLGL